jgi:uncharacterized damage-inducible protein DinB
MPGFPMNVLSHFQTLFEYDAWANREVVAALKNIPSPPSKSVKVAAHIVAAEWLWLNRLHRETQRLQVWPELTVAQIASELNPLPEIWRNVLDGAAERMAEMVEYTNSKGEPWRSTFHDVLTHVVIHSGYHRGQIATDLRAAGYDPPYTDYIHATRQQLIG